jgi:hypothetical protein
MKAIKLFFDCLMTYQQFKYALKENYERLKFHLSIEYSKVMKEIHNSK